MNFPKEIKERTKKRTASRDVAASQSHSALRANQIQPSEIITFAERALLAPRPIDGKEFRSDDVPTVL